MISVTIGESLSPEECHAQERAAIINCYMCGPL
jgi:hypothetical protein